MRVLLLAQFYPPVIGGEERHVRNLAVGLAASGHEVHVGTLDVGDRYGAAVHDDGVTVHRLPHVGGRFPALYPTADRPLAFPVPDPLTTKALAALAREIEPQVVHAHNWIINSWLPLPAAARLPLVYSLHDYSHVCATKRLMYDDQPCGGPAPRRCLSCAEAHYGRGRGAAVYGAVQAGRPARRRRVDMFAPVSRYVATGNRLPESGVPWRLVPNFVPDELLQLRPDRDPALPEHPYFFFAGDLSEQKGVGTLLRAYDRLPADRPELLLVGSPGERFELPRGARIEHRWPHVRVVSGFLHSLAAVLPSQWPDPCPTTVLEAMALGTPVITTHLGGIADMVDDERSGLVVSPADPTALAQAMARVAVDSRLRERLVGGARHQVRGFVRSAVVDIVEQIYTEVSDGRG